MLCKDKHFVIPKAGKVDLTIRPCRDTMLKTFTLSQTEILTVREVKCSPWFSLFALNDQFLQKKLTQRRPDKQKA